MEKVTLEARPRTSLGSGAARRFRREGFIPSVVYGHGDPVPVLVDGRTFEKALKGSSRNLIVTIKIDGRDDTTIIRDIQRHPITRAIAHADFQRVSLTEKITAEVHLELTGISEAVKAGGMLMQMLRSVEIECLPTNIPTKIVVDISGLKEFGDSIHVAALAIPQDVALVTDGEITVVTVQPPAAEEVAAPAAEGAAGAEPEVIAKGKEDKDKKEEAGAPGKKEAAPAKK